MEWKESESVLALIVDGLTERWGKYDPSMNADLHEFPSRYIGSLILVAVRKSEIVGAGILCATKRARAEIVRMSVQQEYRRAGIGSALLSSLLNAARDTGCKQVFLETTESWTSAISFYEKNGFQRIGMVGNDIHFAIELESR